MRSLGYVSAVIFSISLLFLIPLMSITQGIQYNIPKTIQLQTQPSQIPRGIGLVAPAYYVRVISPNGGESIALDGAFQKIPFSIYLDKSKDGKYEFQLELWRNGKKVGNINASPQAFSFKNIETGFGMPQYQAGAYYVGGGTPSNYFVATAGSGYRVRVVALLDGKLVAVDESDSDFTFTAGPPSGKPHVTLITPNGGETFELGKGANVQFSYSDLDPYKLIQYESALQLWQDGKLLGETIGRESLNVNGDKVSISVNIDSYQDPKTLNALKAKEGGGYMLRVIIYESDNPVADDDSDASFSFTKSGTIGPITTFIKGTLSPLQKFWEGIKNLFATFN
ncbi:MAG: hypothetical protein US40_C0003G0004 [Candidatus Roizmanbacteria bacterium GW2011_GWC2_37_13]|uniref:Uncharacterized protein n=1 Tax=Candidatus Roizmanbacteria bacterium GW2011_GWC2_37_13 TaxID=1618486 RepID=A0A0G0G840_9BACT|nr:MAG: hypothetical protein US40_C0003G0004 [Candidatus Roizmanbacteria bacterium GW2011_GWC2_37_13]